MRIHRLNKIISIFFMLVLTQASQAYLTNAPETTMKSGRTYSGVLRYNSIQHYKIPIYSQNGSVKYRKLSFSMTAQTKGTWHVNYEIKSSDHSISSRRLRNYCSLSRDYRTVTCDIPLNIIRDDRKDHAYIFISVFQRRYYNSQKFFLKATLSGRYNYSHPKATGDLVARDLNTPVFGNILGHIGMWDGSRVLEVTNFKHNAVRKISFTNFLNTSRLLYWGARYGKGSYYQRRKAIQEGWNQRKYDAGYVFRGSFREGEKVDKWHMIIYPYPKTNPNYSSELSWNIDTKDKKRWVEIIRGVKWKLKWKRVEVLQRAQFRCDSFVDFSYQKAGIRLSYAIAPRLLFNSMPSKR